MAQSSLLKFQIGPVQDFIAQARSTRDLWSGSYLLSWLVAEGIKALPQNGKELIFPCHDRQPLLYEPMDPKTPGILIPNLPNIFIAEIQGDADTTSKRVREAIEKEWRNIANAVWNHAGREKAGVEGSQRDRFFAQVNRHLSISWMITELPDDSAESYLEAYQHNGWHLDAVRQTNCFSAWDSCNKGNVQGSNEKDSLSGKEEAIFQGSGRPNDSHWHHLLHKHEDRLGAIALIKRVWHVAYLATEKQLPTDSKQHLIRSIPAIAAFAKEHDDDAGTTEGSSGDKYIAAIAFDGDSIGRWVNGDNSPPDTDLRRHHSDFSEALSKFALNRVPEIVEPDGKRLGQLIYAGGDDVVCLVPADAALDVAAKLREAFRDSTADTSSIDEKPDASAGIAIAHIHSPLQDLIREAQKAEKRAKNEVGRPAVSVTLLKRSGEISIWGSKWNSGGIALCDAIGKAMVDRQLSAKFPHRVCELLTPYLSHRSGISAQEDAIENIDIAKELITREFRHAAIRQGSKNAANELEPFLSDYLDGVVNTREKRERETVKTSPLYPAQELFTSLIDLCTTVAFTHRNRDSTNTAEKQIA